MGAAKIVIDTNVVVKFFVQETGSLHAERLLKAVLSADIELVAPDFMLTELVNVLWLKVERGELDDEEAEEIIARLLVLAELIEIIPARTVTVLGSMFQTARRHGHSAYDAAFLALAESRWIRLVTADAKFYQKTRSLSSKLVLLEDWETVLG